MILAWIQEQKKKEKEYLWRNEQSPNDFVIQLIATELRLNTQFW